ncbi:hypothetical protein K458DRAFT_423926 [Lentithecium fluviatile CBS 122367]|uniref:Uncharacterized protein n=1 Tax=Lentithecium fluviatile CBS 122367 TaxID=1168545 RepID=A0A6G1IGV6_9PLEO|nr:hypothetical protein K458DRAFT_423926 [Lentithecium fluviatile CBS 122367]
MLEYFFHKASQCNDIAVIGALLDWSTEHWNPPKPFTMPKIDRTLPWDGMRMLEDGAIRWLDNPQNKEELLDEVLQGAIWNGHISIVDLLCHYVDLQDRKRGSRALRYAVLAPSPSIDLLRLLLRHGLQVPKGIPRGSEGGLRIAVFKGFLDWVDVLLENGADPRDYAGYQGLLDGANRGGFGEDTKVLLEKHGWDIDNLEVPLEVAEEGSGQEQL